MNQRYPQSRHTPHGGSEKTDTEKGTRARKRKRFSPQERVLGQARPAWPHLDFSMSRLRSAGSPARSFARAARCPAQGGSRPRSLGGVKDGTTGQLAVPWRPRASPLWPNPYWPNPEIRCLTHRCRDVCAAVYGLISCIVCISVGVCGCMLEVLLKNEKVRLARVWRRRTGAPPPPMCQTRPD